MSRTRRVGTSVRTGPLMPGELWIALLAGLAGGSVNAAAGGAKLFVFPLLLATGLSPLAANATGTVALWAGQAPAAWVYRRELRAAATRLVRSMAPALVGAPCGALALVFSSERAFVAVIPLLLALAVGAILLGERARGIVVGLVPSARLPAVTGALLFATGFYGGYFGAGLGFMVLAVLGIAGVDELQRANAIKLATVLGINTVAVVPLALSGLVVWSAAVGVLVGALAGGYLGARLARRLPERPLRWIVVALGVVLTVSFLVR